MKKQPKKRIRPPVNLTILDDLVSKTKVIGAREGRSISSYVENLMREDVERYEKENGPIELPDQVAANESDSTNSWVKTNSSSSSGKGSGFKFDETDFMSADELKAKFKHLNPIEKRPIRLKGSPEIQKPRKNESGAASA